MGICGLQCDASTGLLFQSGKPVFQRRAGVSLLGLGVLLNPWPVHSSEQRLQLVPYKDESNRFTMLRPDQWSRVDKDGATVLFEDPGNKSNTLGVVVNPVRISSLADFGNPRDVADRLLAAERNKASTKNVELLEVGSRGEDPEIYEIEYMLDSSRGLKRIFSGVTIWSRKLYIINLAVVDEFVKNPEEELVAKQIVNSFDVLKEK